MEAWSVAGREMDDFKQEVRSEIKQMASSVNKMADAVTMLVESDIRRQEREDRQQETNSRMADDIRLLKNFREDIIVSRAKESPARDWLSKNYPWLVVIAALATAYISKFPIK